MMRSAALLAALLVPALVHGAGTGSLQKEKPPGNKLSDRAVEEQFPAVVLPETTTTVRLSSSDMNRIACPVDIGEALTSTEKGLGIKITGKDAFVKFRVIKKGDTFTYATTPTELYIVCGGETYSMIAFPQRIPSQTIRLASGTGKKIRENRSLYEGLPFEKMVLKAIRDVYTENMPESYNVSSSGRRFSSYRELLITLRRIVDIEGEGFRVKEYEVSLRDGSTEFRMNEKMFLRTELAENPVALSLERHILRPGDRTRVFVVEQRNVNDGVEQLAAELPVMDGPERTSPADPPDEGKESPGASMEREGTDDES
jgi:conjugal transfer pilus assembly protein TraK